MIRGPFDDLVGGARRWRLGMALSWNDSVMPLRSSYLGPVWASLQIGLLALVLFMLFQGMAAQDSNDYAVYVAVGVTVYQFITIGLNDGATAFTRHANLIKNIPHPVSLYVFRLFYKQLILALFASPVLIAAFMYSGHWPTIFGFVLACVGLVVVGLALTGLALLVSTACVLAHDVAFAISSLTRMLFFMTPVFWVAESREGFRGAVATYNPFTYFLNLVREPLRGGLPSALDYAVCLSALLLFWVLGVALFSLVRPRISALI